MVVFRDARRGRQYRNTCHRRQCSALKDPGRGSQVPASINVRGRSLWQRGGFDCAVSDSTNHSSIYATSFRPPVRPCERRILRRKRSCCLLRNIGGDVSCLKRRQPVRAPPKPCLATPTPTPNHTTWKGLHSPEYQELGGCIWNMMENVQERRVECPYTLAFSLATAIRRFLLQPATH